MSALDALLGRDTSRHGTTPSRTLVLPDDILLHLQEDESSEEILIYSIPGSLKSVSWVTGLTEPWIDKRVHPDHPDAASVLTIDPTTQQLLLIEIWQRAALDAPTLAKRLEGHRETHLAWRSLLSPARDINEFEFFPSFFDTTLATAP